MQEAITVASRASERLAAAEVAAAGPQYEAELVAAQQEVQSARMALLVRPGNLPLADYVG